MVIHFITNILGVELATFVIAMLPVLELRAALPFALTMGVATPLAFVLAVAGNLVPVPFIILFIRRIFGWMRGHSPRLQRLVERLETRAKRKAKIFYKYELIGLVILVAIPLPGTGAWTGALVAALLEIRLKVAIPCILLGILIAGLAVSLATLGILHVSG